MSAPLIVAPGKRHAGAPALHGPFFVSLAAKPTDCSRLRRSDYRGSRRDRISTVHANEDEMLFVFGGLMTVQVADQLYMIAAGGLAVAHGIQNAVPILQSTRWTP